MQQQQQQQQQRAPPPWCTRKKSIRSARRHAQASTIVFDWSAFETPIFAQMFSSIGETADVCPAQYCGAFVGLLAAAGRFLRMSCWIWLSVARSLVATGTKPVALRSWKLS